MTARKFPVGNLDPYLKTPATVIFVDSINVESVHFDTVEPRDCWYWKTWLLGKSKKSNHNVLSRRGFGNGSDEGQNSIEGCNTYLLVLLLD